MDQIPKQGTLILTRSCPDTYSQHKCHFNLLIMGPLLEPPGGLFTFRSNPESVNNLPLRMEVAQVLFMNISQHWWGVWCWNSILGEWGERCLIIIYRIQFRVVKNVFSIQHDWTGETSLTLHTQLREETCNMACNVLTTLVITEGMEQL